MKIAIVTIGVELRRDRQGQFGCPTPMVAWAGRNRAHATSEPESGEVSDRAG
jgi:hypothetical protein